MGNSSFGRIRRTMPLIVYGRKDKTAVYDILKSTGYLHSTDVLLREMQLSMATVENQEVQDAARIEPTPLSIYNQEVHPDWAEEFNLTGGGS